SVLTYILDRPYSRLEPVYDSTKSSLLSVHRIDALLYRKYCEICIARCININSIDRLGGRHINRRNGCAKAKSRSVFGITSDCRAGVAERRRVCYLPVCTCCQRHPGSIEYFKSGSSGSSKLCCGNTYIYCRSCSIDQGNRVAGNTGITACQVDCRNACRGGLVVDCGYHRTRKIRAYRITRQRYR